MISSPVVKRIALTGGIASGKSLVGEYLTRQGIPVIDADAVVHRLLHEDKAIQSRIRETFGEAVFAPDGTVNRQALGGVVFQNPALRKQLESWIHPRTRQIIEEFYREQAGQSRAVTLIPLLFESNLEGRYDEVWLVDSGETQQLERLMRHRGMSEADARARIASQMPAAEKRRRTKQLPHHHILDNTGSPETLYNQLDALLS